jgi:hypothetical protein
MPCISAFTSAATILAFLFLICPAQSATCSQFTMLDGVDVDFGVYLTSDSIFWNSSICSSFHPKSIMAFPMTSQIGKAFCSLSGNGYPWAGVRYNETLSKWIWSDGTDFADKHGEWNNEPFVFNDCQFSASVCSPALCGEVDCDSGKLYNAVCTKLQALICQVKCKGSREYFNFLTFVT